MPPERPPRPAPPADFDPAAVPIRPAATVMLVRDVADAARGIEVFMLRRNAGAVFAGGMYVFPGGRVDGVDGTDEIAPFCRGIDDATASAKLGIDHGGLAYWVAAARECFEEAGVLLAAPREGSGPIVLDADDRHHVHDSSLSLVDLCRRSDLVLELGATHYVAHWITPMGEQRRFDTRFFVTEMPDDQVPVHDDQETVDSLWVQPADALDRQRDGELLMLPPTVATLGFLAEHDTAAAVLRAGAAIDRPPTIEPRLRLGPDGGFVGISMPGDDDYERLAGRA